jgi:four helix bundle protein
MAFAFESMTVYGAAIDLVEQMHGLLRDLGPTCPRAVREQVSRAVLGIPLNVAEGNGRWDRSERQQFFWLARSAVFECVALVRVMERLGLLRDDDAFDLGEQLERISKMLTALVRSVDELRRSGQITLA